MHRTTLALAVTLSLFASTPQGNALLEPLWALLSSVWATSTADAGCGADPNGACSPEPAPRLDIGCGADPDGALCIGALPSA
jgi:hypothetical protein